MLDLQTQFDDDCRAIAHRLDEAAAELNASHERIDELKASLAEMVQVYWGQGDGHEPPPACIQRAMAALSEDVKS